MDIFDGEEEILETIDAEPVELARDDKGRFASKETGVEPQETAEPVPPTDKLPPEEFAGLKDERRKRQEAEQRASALEEQLQQFQQQPPEPPPSIWEDEQAALQHHGQAIAAQASMNARLDMSEMLASQNHEDFDQMKAKFVEMMALNPALQQQALAAKHPWEKAYQIASNAARMEALGAVDVADMEAKLREQIKAEMTAQPPQTQLPNSLADAPSGRGGAGSGAAPFTLEDIIGR